MRASSVLLLVTVLAAEAQASPGAASLEVVPSPATIGPGDEISVSVALTSDADVIGIEHTLEYPEVLKIDSCARNPELVGDSAQFLQECPDGSDTCTLRALVFSFQDLTPLPNAVLYSCSLRVGLGSPIGDYDLVCSDADASDRLGDSIATTCQGASLEVRRPTETPSPLPTSSATQTPTATSTASGTPTATPSSTPTMTPSSTATSTPTFTATSTATPTPTAVCAGDCDLDGRVTIGELVLAVRIALGTRSVAECVAADTDSDGVLRISELIAAVTRALEGCERS